MIGVLLGSSEYLTLVLGGAPAGTQPIYMVAASGGVGGHGKTGSLNGGTAVTALQGIDNTPVIIHQLLVHNADSAAVTLTVRKKISSTNYQLFKLSVPSLGTFLWDKNGARVVDASGNTLSAPSAGTAAGYGAAAGTGVTASETGGAPVHQTVLSLVDTTIAVTDANAYGSQKIYDFPEGRIAIHGVTCNLQWGVTTTRASTINDSAALKFAVGSAAASNSTLATTMVDLIPKTSKTLDGVAAAYAAAQGAALAASTQFDGTATALDAYLNVAFETGTDIDGDGTLKVTGTVTLTWTNLGDY